MAEHVNKIIDVTIVYPGTIPSFWTFISGRSQRIIVDFQVLDAGWQLQGDYFNDPDFRDRFCRWLNQLWHEKDNKIKQLLS